MKLKIWSDVMCPFCYIGKRKFEMALEKFPHKEEVEIEWKSFQLNPDLVTNPLKNINEHLAEHKGIGIDDAKRMHKHVTEMATAVELHYDFDKAVVANSFDAHRLSHLAKKYGKQNALEERMFKAYFSEGKNTADHDTLIHLAEEVGLNSDEVRTMLAGNDFADDVTADTYEAQQVGVRGVPFFVFNDTYAVSGAQPSELFLNALTQSYNEWSAGKKLKQKEKT